MCVSLVAIGLCAVLSCPCHFTGSQLQPLLITIPAAYIREELVGHCRGVACLRFTNKYKGIIKFLNPCGSHGDLDEKDLETRTTPVNKVSLQSLCA